MMVDIPTWWYWFIACFNVLLVTTMIMTRQSRYFLTQGKTKRHFSMMDLEFPASEESLIELISGIDALPRQEAERSKKALRGQLYVDFLFMPAAYGAIFLLCMKTAYKMGPLGQEIFATLAWLQVIPWICDIAENWYLLKKINRPSVVSGPRFKWYQRMEIAKWGIALVGLICALFALTYYWIVGQYHLPSLKYVGIVVLEMVLFIFIIRKKNQPATGI